MVLLDCVCLRVGHVCVCVRVVLCTHSGMIQLLCLGKAKPSALLDSLRGAGQFSRKAPFHLLPGEYEPFLKNILLICPWETQRERQRHRQREKQAPCREPDVGLDPGTLGSWPELKTDAQPLTEPPRHPLFHFLKNLMRTFTNTQKKRQWHVNYPDRTDTCILPSFFSEAF